MLFMWVHPLEQTLHFGKIAQSSATYSTSSGYAVCSNTAQLLSYVEQTTWRHLGDAFVDC
jgi:hypothetical protein